MQDDCIPVPLGIPGLRVVSCAPGELGGLEVGVESEARGGLCPECGAAALVAKDRPLVLVRDLPIRGLATWLRWRKRRYRCPACGGSRRHDRAIDAERRCPRAHSPVGR